jgi:thiol-disulfide isomerase/thioredoxin
MRVRTIGACTGLAGVFIVAAALLARADRLRREPLNTEAAVSPAPTEAAAHPEPKPAAFLALGLRLPALSASRDEGNPRYSLSTGREFAFHGEARSEGKGNDSVYLIDWKVWAPGRDPDGAWRLVIRCDLRTRRDKGPAQPQRDEADTLVWRCRMFDDGTLVGATTMGTVRDPFRLFPRLPVGQSEREKGWTSTGSDKDGVTFRHRLTTGDPADVKTLMITTQAGSSSDKVYGSSHECVATFDRRRGVVTRIETKDGSGYPRPSTTRGVIELVGIEDRGEAWAESFGREADRYFEAVEAYDAATKRAAEHASCKEIVADARSSLEKARAGLTAPVFLDSIGKRLAAHEREAGYLLEQANDHATRLGKPAADWEAKDIEGRTHTLAEYRGKVVVMDFWYRGCGWCMFAMPQVIRLAATFRNEPVAILGMTIDEDEKDTRAVIDGMAITYPTIRANGIPAKYGVTGYPTLIVLDRAGKVRKIHVGYSPRLDEELSDLIRELLNEKPTNQ